MSDGRPESGEVLENPEPEADSELPGINEAVENEGELAEANTTDQPEDECLDLRGECETSESGQLQQATGEQADSVEEDIAEESDCVEGEEAEGVVPFRQNITTDSEGASPEHQILESASSGHSDVAESENFSIHTSPEQRPHSSNGSNPLEDQLALPVALDSGILEDAVQDKNRVSQGVAVSSTAGESTNLSCSGDRVVNGGDSEVAIGHPGQHKEARDSAAPEDESPDREATVEDGQAPECDRDFGLGRDSESTAMSRSDEQEAEIQSELDSTEDPGVIRIPEAKVNSSSDDQSDMQVPRTDDSPESSQSVQAQKFSGDVEEVEMGVELSEDYSDGQGSVENEPVVQCVETSSSTVGAEPLHSAVSDSNSVAVSNPPQNSQSPGGSPASHNKKQSPEKSSLSGSDSVKALDNFEDDLLSELDAALHSQSDGAHSEPAVEAFTDAAVEPVQEHEQLNGSSTLLNGLNIAGLSESPQLKAITDQLLRMQKQVEDSEKKLNRLHAEKQQQSQALATTVKERDVYQAQVQSLKSRCPDDLYIPQIKELEYTIAKQQNELRGLKDKLSSHDNAAKRAVSTLQNELKVRVDQVTKMYEECVREKDSMVIKYAESEQKNIECHKALEKMEGKIRESAKDRESMVSKVKSVKAEKNRAVADMEAKSAELSRAMKEVEKLQEALSTADVRIKWSQNKLKAELEAHKDTKVVLEKTNIKLKEAREETQQIRRDCQAMIKTYQESEEIKSNSLDKELKVKETELIIQRQERSDREELYQMTAKELESLKAKHKDAFEELLTLRDKVKCEEEEIEQRDQTLTKYENIIQKQKVENKDLHTRTDSMGQLQDDFARAQEMIKTLDRDISDLMVSNKDLQQDMEGCRRRESELLDLTEKLSRKNAKLQSDNTNLNNQVVTLSSEAEKWKMEIQELETRVQDLEERLAAEQKQRKEQTESLTSQLEEKTKHMENYRQQMEDEKDLNRTLKRKHVNNVKDLTRQLQQARKKLETLENHTERDTTSMGSRTSSNGSLNTVADNAAAQNNTNSNHNSSTNSRAPSQEHEYPVITEQVEVDKQVLIERIVRLQKAHARKNEKLEFLDDHIHQLVDEVQKKNRIIQNYVMREESGTLAPEYMDENKLRVRTEAQALLAKKGGIMASVYSTHQQDGAMTLDLSLEINKKLQSVLEDTLLKNITLKESLDTLGTEIARLSQENRQLQLKIQELPH